jgi:hypothetical protein
MVMKKRYGQELMGRFLRKELQGYLSGRSNEKKKENPLLDIEFQSYAYYNKGSLAMFNIMDLLGEERMNEFLGNFVGNYQFKSRPYPSTHDYYQTLLKYLVPGQQTLVDDQLKRITLYKNKIAEAKGRKLADGQFEIKVKYNLEKVYVDSLGGNERQAPITELFYVGLLNEQKPKVAADVVSIEKMKLTNNQEVTFKVAKKPKYAGIDPLHTLTDILVEDNTKLIDWE